MSNDEYFDVVDAADNVLRAERRFVVHRDKLMHRAVHVLVFNCDGKLYIQRRSMQKDSAPGKWVSSCSGHVDSGENYDEAVVRELKEEIGLTKPGQLERLFKLSPCEETGHEFVWLYRCFAEGPFVLNPDEIIEGRWIDTGDLDRWVGDRPRDFAWSFVYLWSKYKAEFIV